MKPKWGSAARLRVASGFMEEKNDLNNPNVKGVGHKFLILDHANHAFESSKRKNWHRILTHWV
jgi:hypothetical protein